MSAVLMLSCFSIMTAVSAWSMGKVFQPVYDLSYTTQTGNSYNRKMTATSVKIPGTVQPQLGFNMRTKFLWWTNRGTAYHTYTAENQTPVGFSTADSYKSGNTEFKWFLNNDGYIHANLYYEVDTF